MAAEGAAGLGSRGANLEALLRRVLALTDEAEAATRRYDRTAWIRYVALWIPIPMFVLAFKQRLEVWHYFALGALFFAVGVVIYVAEVKAAARRDRAIDAAAAAQDAYQAALRASRREDG